MRISVVLPIYNEEAVLKKSLQDVMKKMKQIVSTFEILAVDDGSVDTTSVILKNFKEKYKNFSIITHTKNKGYGAVIKSGVKHAKYEWIFFTDADLQFDVLELKKFLPFAKKNEFVIGFRKRRAEGARRRIISHTYNRIIRMLFGFSIKDVDCAFKLMKKSSLQKIRLQSNSFFVSCELMVKAAKKKYAIKELPVQHYKRAKGESKVTMTKVIKTISDLFSLYKTISL
ncbi:MAG TPA: glycosyltransferase family 2 protein [Patescibacteria group bacterium]|nr:glycosyltransferase family 2 protein [Patescibacteria group bacterium]